MQSKQSSLDQSIENRIFLQSGDQSHVSSDSSPPGSPLQESLSDSSVILDLGGAEAKEQENPDTGSLSVWSNSYVSPPLCPTIIPSDPQRDSVSKVIKRTKESVVYAQISKDL